jgi:hypothetical protein
VQSEFSTVFLQEHFYVSAIEIEFRICFRVLAGRKAAEVLLQRVPLRRDRSVPNLIALSSVVQE